MSQTRQYHGCLKAVRQVFRATRRAAGAPAGRQNRIRRRIIPHLLSTNAASPDACLIEESPAGARSARLQAADQPDHAGNKQEQAKNAAKAGPAIPAVTIVATASEQQNQQDDNQNCTQCSTLLEVSVYP
jgi:hypothetical protein